jgi:hypothetical protein
MLSWNQRKTSLEFEKWVKTPLYDDGDDGNDYDGDDYDGNDIYSITRGAFIYQFVKLYLEPWLNKNKYTLGKNLKEFPSKLLHWWFFQKKEFNLKKPFTSITPKHRNLLLDFDTFFFTLDISNFNEFLEANSTYEFCDDSPFGLYIYHRIKRFVYCYIDIDLSPASIEINMMLQDIKDENERRKSILKGNHHHHHDYDQSELGYYKGNRIMSP